MIPDMRIGDLFLYEDLIVLRVYGFEQEPYKLPNFLTPKVFSMEYTRKRFIYGHIHFIHLKHQRNFLSPKELGPFLVKGLNVVQYME